MIKKFLFTCFAFILCLSSIAQIDIYQFSSDPLTLTSKQWARIDTINIQLSKYKTYSTYKSHSINIYKKYNSLIESSIQEINLSNIVSQLDTFKKFAQKGDSVDMPTLLDKLKEIQILVALKKEIIESAATPCKISVTTTKIINGDYQVLVYDSITNNKEIFRAPLQREAFNAQLEDAIKRLRPNPTDSTCIKEIVIKFTEKEFRKFLEVALAIDKLSPQAGTLYINRRVPLYHLAKNDSATNLLTEAFNKNKKQKAILQSTLSLLKKAKKLDKKIKKVKAKIAAIKDSTKLDSDTAKYPNKPSADTLKVAPGKSKTTGHLYKIPDYIIPGKELACNSAFFPFFAENTAGNVQTKVLTDTITLISGSVQIQDGFIENIYVIGKDDLGNILKYENGVAIPFSTRYDFNRLYEYKLYTFKGKTNQTGSLRLSDILSYIPTFSVNRRDYCPADTVIQLNFGKVVTQHALLKLSTHKIFTASVFTDLMGVAEDKPNGLVQLEISRQTNLWTNRWQVKNSGWGVFNYITPYFTQSKIENKERRLVTSADSSNTIKFTTYLKLLEYQLFNTGFIQNIGIWDVPRAKSLFHFNFGLSYGRTAMRDTLFNTDSLLVGKAIATGTENFGVNTLQFAPQITWDIRPDERYGFLITDRIHLITAFTEKIRVIGNKNVIQNNKTLEINEMSSLNKDQGKFGVVNTFELFAFFKPVKAEDHKLYFRYRLNSDLHNFKFNYHQLQIGYSFYLTTK